MGCDIHIVVEVKHNDQWVGIHACPYAHMEIYPPRGAKDVEGKDLGVLRDTGHWPIRSRNYELFAALAGVRGKGPKAKGIPKDASTLTLMENERWGVDGHSHSWCTAEHFVKLASKHESLPDLVQPAIEQGAEDTLRTVVNNYMGASLNDDDSLATVRVVFWFDN